jgi:hypothetical protein
VHRLLRDAELVGDLLPGIAALPGVLDMEPLEPLEQAAQGRNRAQPGIRIVGCDL